MSNTNKVSIPTIVFAGLLLAVLVVGLYLAWSINIEMSEKVAQEEEEARPANLEVTIITDSECLDCFEITRVLDALKKTNVKVTEQTLEFDSDEGQKLVSEFSIEKVPTFIAKGELEKNEDVTSFLGNAGIISNGVFLFTRVSPPYLEVATGEVRGRFSLTYLTDTSCAECYDVQNHNIALANFGMRASEDKVVDVSQEEGKKLQKDYKITKVPTIIISGDLDEYTAFQQVWPKVGTIEGDGTYVFRDGLPQMGTYKDLSTGEIVKPKPPSSESEN